MVKKPEMRHRYRIIVECDPADLGQREIQLLEMGFENIHHELITDVITFKGNGTKHDTTGEVFAEAWTVNNPFFAIGELIGYFRANDRTPGSGYSAVKNLVEKGVLKKLGPARYARTDVKQLAGPKTAHAEKPARPATFKYEVSNETLILKAIKNRKKVTLAEMRQLLTDEGRSGKSASPLFTTLMRRKVVKQLGPGEYEVLKAAPKKPPAATPSQKRDKDRVRKQKARARTKQSTPAPSTTEGTTHGQTS